MTLIVAPWEFADNFPNFSFNSSIGNPAVSLAKTRKSDSAKVKSVYVFLRLGRGKKNDDPVLVS